jgi:predicted ATPase
VLPDALAEWWRVATSLARLWKAQDRSDPARDLLAPIYADSSEGFDTQHLKDAKVVLEQLT